MTECIWHFRQIKNSPSNEREFDIYWLAAGAVGAGAVSSATGNSPE